MSEDKHSNDSAEFTVVVRDQRDVTVVELFGDLDLSTSSAFREAIVSLDLNSGREVQMDLTELTFLGSPGIGVIVSACKRVRDSGGTFSVICDNPMIRKTLEVAGLVDYLELNEADLTR